MPVTPTYPGVYVEEIPSGVRTITGVATSITASHTRASVRIRPGSAGLIPATMTRKKSWKNETIRVAIAGLRSPAP